MAARDEVEAPLVPRGNRLRWGRGGAVTIVGVLLGVLFSILPWGPRAGVPLVSFAVVVTTFGILDLLGTFDDTAEPAHRVTLRWLAPSLGLAAGGGFVTFFALRLAVDGRFEALPGDARIWAGATITACFILAITGVALVLQRLGVLGARPFYRREGYWLLVYVTLLLLPALGTHSLTDPWETHYGEVAREILAREDWISLWWAQEGWFWSKPVLGFWIQALSMAVLGVRYEPGGMLSAALEGRTPYPEWAVRMPIFVLTLLATYVLYKAVSRAFGRRAGLFGGVVLTTMPQWFFISHQTMTDMPFVAAMVGAMGFFLLGVREDASRHVAVFEIAIGPFRPRVSGRHLLLGIILATVLPQLVYLLTRNVSINLDPVYGLLSPPIRFHSDSFMFGSAGNCGALPGNEACSEALPISRALHPALQVVLWVQALALLLYLVWGERRAQRLFFLAAWYCAALSTLGKGPAGVVLPVAAIVGYVIVTGRWRDLFKLEMAAGTLIVLVIALPWFVAMYARHGQPFTDRLLFHDMLKRAFDQVHDTNRGQDVSFRYYVWQLGYATFPWVGLVPAGVFAWLKSRSLERDVEEAGTLALLFTWFVTTFALFSYMQTKFHHYVFPALPPVAMLIGIAIDRAASVPLIERDTQDAWRPMSALATGILLTIAAAAIAFSGGDADASAIPRHGPSMRTVAVLAALFVGGGVLVFLARGRARAADGGIDARHEGATFAIAAIAGAVLTYLVGRDLAQHRPDQPSDARLLHLFTYNYEREWPESLDYSAPLWAFTFATAATLVYMASARLRRGAIVALFTTSTFFAAWCLDLYFVETAPHWGQRDIVLSYLRETQKIDGPIVAYQMNWKGENFYFGNQIAAFVSSGKAFRDWIQRERRQGQKTFYFLLLPGRIGSLSGELGQTKELTTITELDDNNKFILVRATYR